MGQQGSSGGVLFKVHTADVEQEESGIVERLARCPYRGWLSLDTCESCEGLHGFERDENGAITALVCKNACAAPCGELVEEPRNAVKTPVWEMMPREVTCVQQAAPIDHVAKVMEQRRIDAVPVVDDHDALVGLITLQGLMARQRPNGGAQTGDRAPGKQLTALEIMQAKPLAIRELTSVSDASLAMASQGVAHCVVLAEDGAVLSVLSSIDLLRWYAERDEV